MKNVSSALPLILLIGAFWLLVIRPNKKRQLKAAEMRNSLAIGQRVLTTSGVFGTIVALGEDSIDLEVAPGVTTTWLKGAISRAVAAEQASGEGA